MRFCTSYPSVLQERCEILEKNYVIAVWLMLGRLLRKEEQLKRRTAPLFLRFT